MKLKRFAIIFFIGAIAALAFNFIAIAAIDAPHNESNYVECGSCHGDGILESVFWGGSGTYDRICTDKCHTVSFCPYTDLYAPAVVTHKDSDNTELAECRTCHDPHYQKQKNYKSTDWNNLYLAYGIITSFEYNDPDDFNADGLDPDGNGKTYSDPELSHTSVLTYSSITYKTGTGWDAERIPGKTEECRHSILFPNVKKLGYSYPVIAVDEGSHTITVKGDVTSVYQYITTSDFAVMYGQFIKDYINGKTVKFFDQTGINSFADGDTAYNGVCEVCHTQTKHYRNNGGAPDQDHSNIGGANGSNCSRCHGHKGNFRHDGGEDCIECHGHDYGYEYSPGKFSEGRGTFISHSTHTEKDSDDLKGPNIACGDCHNTNKFPNFKTGTDSNGDGKIDLSETDVCNNCHSTGGSYNGVSDSSIGAKSNWDRGVYEVNVLKSGKEKWCVGCHDYQGALIRDVLAPPVAGDNVNYGFYVTGHGLESGTYPFSGEKAAHRKCTDCHDTKLQHIDGQQRTYSVPLNNYVEGYRLKRDETGSSLYIPRYGRLSDYTLDLSHFSLCFRCHDQRPFEGVRVYDADLGTYYWTYTFLEGTNFRRGTDVNAHVIHLGDGNLQALTSWDSDWDGYRESKMSCPACHNVHGSPSPRMIRHGELISTPGTMDKVPALSFHYVPYPPDTTSMADSTGGIMALGNGMGAVETTGVCVMCHNQRIEYSRAPVTVHTGPIDLRATEESGPKVRLTWTNPVQPGFIGTHIIRNVDDFPSDITDGTEVYLGTVQTCIDSSVSDNTTYYYKAFAEYAGPAYASSDLAQASLTVGSPKIKSIKALDASFGGYGIQTGDQVKIVFTESTNAPVIDKNNIDTALALSTGTWLSGSGDIQSALWATTWNENDTLIITLSASDGAPTVAIGATITPDGATIQDVNGNPLLDTGTISGSFHCAMISATAYDGNGDYREVAHPMGQLDYVRIRFSDQIIINPAINTTALSYDIDNVLILNNGHSWVDSDKGGGPRYDAFVRWRSTVNTNDTLIIRGDVSGAPWGDPTIVPGDTITLSDRVKDRDGNSIEGQQVTMDGSFFGSKTLTARDTNGLPGIQAGDQVVIGFSRVAKPDQFRMNGYPITKDNIASVLPLRSGHTWKDGSGNIGSAIWSSDQRPNDTLTITLSDTGGIPTVVVGDVWDDWWSEIRDENDIEHSSVHWIGSSVIRGSFDPLAGIQSAADMSYAVGDPCSPAADIIITDVSTPSIKAATDIKIRIPRDLEMTWDIGITDISGMISGTAADGGRVGSTVTYENSNKTIKIAVLSDFLAGDTLIISGLRFCNFSEESTGDNLELEIANNGHIAAIDDKTISISSSIPNPQFYSSSNQVFYISDPPTTISPINIVNVSGINSITAANDIRITIPDTLGMVWDIDDFTPLFSGTAAAKVSDSFSVANYLNAGKTLFIDVLEDFNEGDTLTVSGLGFEEFIFAFTSGDHLTLIIVPGEDPICEDEKSISIMAGSDASWITPYAVSPDQNSRIIDGNVLTGNSSTDNDFYFTLDSTASSYSISKFRIYGGPDVWRCITVYISEDTDNWGNALFQCWSIGGASWSEINITDTVGKYIRIVSTMPAPAAYLPADSIFEFQFEGIAVP
jgi:hypothetical protein